MFVVVVVVVFGGFSWRRAKAGDAASQPGARHRQAKPPKDGASARACRAAPSVGRAAWRLYFLMASMLWYAQLSEEAV